MIPGASPLPAREAIPELDYAITHDLVRRTVTTRYSCRLGVGVNQSGFTVSAENPAEVVVQSRFDYSVTYPEGEITVETQCVTARRHFTKSWSVSIKREFN